MSAQPTLSEAYELRKALQRQTEARILLCRPAHSEAELVANASAYLDATDALYLVGAAVTRTRSEPRVRR